MTKKQKNLCIMCRSKLVRSDSKEGIERLRNWTNKGKAWAMVMLAERYEDGEGVKQSENKGPTSTDECDGFDELFECDQKIVSDAIAGTFSLKSCGASPSIIITASRTYYLVALVELKHCFLK